MILNRRLLLASSVGITLLTLFNSCGNLDSPDDSAPKPSSSTQSSNLSNRVVPVLIQDFLDKVGATTVSLYSATAELSGAMGTTIQVQGFDAQVSLDGTSWSQSVIANSDNATLHIRMTSDADVDVIRRAHVTVGGLSFDWAISTHSVSRTFGTPGTFRFTKIEVGRTMVVECWGGGGGGARVGSAFVAGKGGGGGGYSRRVFNQSEIAAFETMAIGRGGAEGVNGESSSFGSHLVAGGGFAGKDGATGGTGLSESGASGIGQNGGKGGGPLGGAGGGPGLAGSSPGGGGGATPSGGGAPGGDGRCIIALEP